MYVMEKRGLRHNNLDNNTQKCIHLLAFQWVSPCRHLKHTCFNSGDFHIATVRMVSVTARLALPAWQLLCLCLSPSAVVVGAAGRPSLIKEHKGIVVAATVCGCCLLAGQIGPLHMEPGPLVSFVVSHGQHSIMPQAKEWNSRFSPISGHLPSNFTTLFFCFPTVFFLALHILFLSF